MITLATLPQATAQEVFDQAAKHLLTQGEKALSTGGVCTFLNAAGLKCAGGCFLSREEFEALPEPVKGGNWRDIARITGVHAHVNLIRKLQWVHDTHEPDEWPQVLKYVAMLYDLRYNAEAYSDCVIQP